MSSGMRRVRRITQMNLIKITPEKALEILAQTPCTVATVLSNTQNRFNTMCDRCQDEFLPCSGKRGTLGCISCALVKTNCVFTVSKKRKFPGSDANQSQAGLGQHNLALVEGCNITVPEFECEHQSTQGLFVTEDDGSLESAASIAEKGMRGTRSGTRDDEGPFFIGCLGESPTDPSPPGTTRVAVSYGPPGVSLSNHSSRRQGPAPEKQAYMQIQSDILSQLRRYLDATKASSTASSAQPSSSSTSIPMSMQTGVSTVNANAPAFDLGSIPYPGAPYNIPYGLSPTPSLPQPTQANPNASDSSVHLGRGGFSGSGHAASQASGSRQILYSSSHTPISFVMPLAPEGSNIRSGRDMSMDVDATTSLGIASSNQSTGGTSVSTGSSYSYPFNSGFDCGNAQSSNAFTSNNLADLASEQLLWSTLTAETSAFNATSAGANTAPLGELPIDPSLLDAPFDLFQSDTHWDRQPSSSQSTKASLLPSGTQVTLGGSLELSREGATAAHSAFSFYSEDASVVSQASSIGSSTAYDVMAGLSTQTELTDSSLTSASTSVVPGPAGGVSTHGLTWDVSPVAGMSTSSATADSSSMLAAGKKL